MPFRCISPILWWGHIQTWSATWLTKTESAFRDATSKGKKGLQAFLWIINYLCKFFCSTSEICESLRNLTSARTEWTWNAINQSIFDKAKSIIEDACMKRHDETKPLHIETNAPGVGLGDTLLQTRSNSSGQKDKAADNSILRPIAFASKSLTAAGNMVQQQRKRSPRHTIQTQAIKKH